MIGDISKAENIYIFCGYQSVGNGIDSLASKVKSEYGLDPLSNSVFLFCGKSSSEMKILYWEGDGFVLIKKRLEDGRYRWPRNKGKKEVKLITKQQFEWLSSGLSIDQKPSIRRPKKVVII